MKVRTFLHIYKHKHIPSCNGEWTAGNIVNTISPKKRYCEGSWKKKEGIHEKESEVAPVYSHINTRHDTGTVRFHIFRSVKVKNEAAN